MNTEDQPTGCGDTHSGSNATDGSLDNGIWREAIKARSYDVDFAKRARPEAICRWFLEAAWNHAEQLGVGYHELSRQNRLWVLSRLLVQIENYPCWGEAFELSTWPRGFCGAFALRDFEMHARGGRRVAGGSSSWLILDASTHRPQRPNKLALQLPNTVTRLASDRDPEKLADTPKGSDVLKITVHYSDIDVNRHANSAKYVAWLLDSYPAEFHHENILRSLEVNYLGETRWGDRIVVSSYQIGAKHFAHSIVNSTGVEVCRGQLLWTAAQHDQETICPV